MIRARSTRLIGSVRDREISSKRRRCSASVGSAITRRGATIGSPNPIPARLLPHLVQNAESRPNILIYRNLYTSVGFDTDRQTELRKSEQELRATIESLSATLLHGSAGLSVLGWVRRGRFSVR